jgi:UDPglucose--hexose-1-phosphate uridylyltransferase
MDRDRIIKSSLSIKNDIYLQMSKELRYNPLLGEWVIYADNREERPLFPGECPFCDVEEVPVSIDNRYPSLSEKKEKKEKKEDKNKEKISEKGRRAIGKCEVIIYSKDHDTKISSMKTEEIAKVVDLWKERYEILSKKYKTVFIFENRGKEIGVTLEHPHGQIYAMNFYPPMLANERKNYNRYKKEKGRCLFCDLINHEKEEGKRILEENDTFISFVPYFARWSFETHIYPKDHVSNICKVDSLDLASILKDSLKRIEKVGEGYIFCVHQFRDDFHFHLEIYPPYSAKNRIKYRGGVETGSGTFINSIFPEDSAKMLRNL